MSTISFNSNFKPFSANAYQTKPVRQVNTNPVNIKTHTPKASLAKIYFTGIQNVEKKGETPKMILEPDCILCSTDGILNLFKKGHLDSKYQEEILRKIFDYYSKADYNQLTIAASKDIHKIVRDVSGNDDPFKSLKSKYNEEALNYYQKYEKSIKTDKNPLDKAMRFAIAGNIIDFGLVHDFDVEEKINNVFESEFPVDDSKELFDEINKAKSILYLGDNTGEIVFDKLFLETIKHPNVTFVVRDSPILNDATKEDAEWAGIDKTVKEVITNGDNSPGTLLNSVSEEFLDHFNSADLIISKGQGNFEGLSHITDKNIYFLLTVKCDLVAERLGVAKGDSVVKSAMAKSSVV